MHKVLSAPHFHCAFLTFAHEKKNLINAANWITHCRSQTVTNRGIFFFSQIDIQKSMSQLSLRTKSNETIDANAVINAAKVGALTSVGIFKGQLVAIKSLSNTMGELTRNDLMELKEVMKICVLKMYNILHVHLGPG